MTTLSLNKNKIHKHLLFERKNKKIKNKKKNGQEKRENARNTHA